MINPPEWGQGRGWEFPHNPTHVTGGYYSEPLLVVAFAQALNGKQDIAVRNAIENMTPQEKSYLNTRPREVRRICIWRLAGLSIAELVLDV